MAEDSSRPEMRAADRDREAVAEVLRVAVGEGRLDIHELDERLGATYAARTYTELDRVVADLPGGLLPWSRADGPEKPLVLSAGWSSQKRTGVWTVPRRLVAETKLCDVRLDFRQARCPHTEVGIELRGGAGNLVLVLPDDWAVDTDGVNADWGSVRNHHRAPPGPGRPTIVVTGATGLGTLKTRGPYFYE